MTDTTMKKVSFAPVCGLCAAAVTALLLMPYEREKTARGCKLHAVLYDFEYEKIGETRCFRAECFGVVQKQVRLLKDLLTELG